MDIECPGCNKTYKVEMPSVAPEGIEIHCENCKRTFLIRPHGARTPVEGPKERASPPGPHPVPAPPEPAAALPEETCAEEPFDPSLFLQRDEIPYRIVEAFEKNGRKAVLPSFGEPEELWSSPEASVPLEPEAPDLPLDEGPLADVEPLADFGSDSYFSKPSPLGKDIVVGKKRSGRRLRLWVGGGLGVALVVGLALLVGRYANQASLQRLKEIGRSAVSLLHWKKLEHGKIQISDLNGYFQDRTGKDPPVFVIEGNITNRHKSPCHSVQVKGILFDERGKPATEKVAFCGNVLAAEQIKSLPRKKIEESLQNAYGSTLSNFNVEPGSTVPFMIIFFDPPAKLSEFSLEIHGYTLQEPGGG
jgi:predicted Zn finger-like uncharacterized protein